MPTAILTDEDFKKMFEDLGYNCNTIISKKINDKGEVEVIWKHHITE